MRQRSYALGAIVVLLVGCGAETYKAPTEGPVATVTTPGLSTYYEHAENCSYGHVIEGPYPKPVVVAANKDVSFLIGAGLCNIIFTFAVQDQKSYTIAFESHGNKCFAAVFDTTDPKASLQVPVHQREFYNPFTWTNSPDHPFCK